MGKPMNTSVKVRGVDEVAEGLSDLKQWGEGDVKYVVGTGVEYAVYLEFGTSRMPPYPFLRPAAEYVMQNKADTIAEQAESLDDLIGGIALAIEKRAKHYATTGVEPGPDVQTDTLRSSIKAEKA